MSTRTYYEPSDTTTSSAAWSWLVGAVQPRRCAAGRLTAGKWMPCGAPLVWVAPNEGRLAYECNATHRGAA